MSKPNGIILYSGPSLIDGAPIVAIAVGLNAASTNRKTGGMVQTYILRSDLSPLEAVRQGADFSICGTCLHRGEAGDGSGRTCYVNLGQGPRAVFDAYRRSLYPVARQYAGMYFVPGAGGAIANGAHCVAKDKTVRLGTYGDPAAVPVAVWLRLLKFSKGHTGYTHQWRNEHGSLSTVQLSGIRALCMASVDTPEDHETAANLGWRTFRVAMKGDDVPIVGTRREESLCPASEAAGKLLTCERCLACSGADGRRGSIYIPAHGGFAVRANLKKRSDLALQEYAPRGDFDLGL